MTAVGSSRAAAALVLLAGASASARAQTTALPAAAPEGPGRPPAERGDSAARDGSGARFCWRGQPLPRCRAFAVFELAGHQPFGGTSRVAAPPPAGGGAPAPRVATFGFDVGLAAGAMRNVGARIAVGGVLSAAGSERASYWTATVRGRRWMDARTSVELAAGPAYAWLDEQLAPAWPSVVPAERRRGVVAEARVNRSDLLALSARTVVLPRAGARTERAAFLGVALGSRAAVAGTAALLAIGAVVLGAVIATL